MRGSKDAEEAWELETMGAIRLAEPTLSANLWARRANVWDRPQGVFKVTGPA